MSQPPASQATNRHQHMAQLASFGEIPVHFTPVLGYVNAPLPCSATKWPPHATLTVSLLEKHQIPITPSRRAS